MKKLRNAVWNALLLLGMAAIPRLRRPALLRLARGIGWLFYTLGFHARRVALANTRIVFGRPRPDLIRKSFNTFALTVLEIFWSRRLNAANISEVVEVDEDRLQAARKLLDLRKGLIAVNLHFSNWEMMGLALAYRGFKINYIAVPTKNPRMDEILNAHRVASGLQTVWRRGAAPKLLRALKRGESISMMMDINVSPRRGGVWVDFFGLPVCVSGLTALLAQRTGAPIIAAFCLSLPNGRYRVVIGPQIPCAPDEDPRAVAQRIMKFAEDALLAHPDDWWWVYKRWKYRPADTTLAYPFYSKPVVEAAGAASGEAAKADE